jgi:hypothetical protein
MSSIRKPLRIFANRKRLIEVGVPALKAAAIEILKNQLFSGGGECLFKSYAQFIRVSLANRLMGGCENPAI